MVLVANMMNVTDRIINKNSYTELYFTVFLGAIRCQLGGIEEIKVNPVTTKYEVTDG